MTNTEAVATIRGIFARGICPMTDITSEILDLALQKGEEKISLYCHVNNIFCAILLSLMKFYTID